MQPTSQNQDPINTTPPQAPMSPPTPRSRRTLIATVVGISVIVIAAGLAFWSLTLYKKAYVAPSSTATQTSAPTSAFTGLTAGIPNYAFRNSVTTHGTSIGYVRHAVVTSSAPHAISLAATTTVYEPVVFYTGTASGKNQIFILTTSDKQTSQITSGANAANTPVFSSVNQLLAYQQNCQVHIVTAQKTDDVIASNSLPTTDCYVPVSWSPDGTILAFYGVTDNAFPDLGLVSKSTLYLYDTASKTIDTIPAPDGYTSLSAGEIKWVDDHMLLAHYVVWAKFAAIEKEAVFAVTTTTGKAIDTPIPASVSLPTIQLVNSKIYAYDNGSHAVMMLSSIDDRAPDVITETDSWSSFLLQSDADTTDQASLYGMTGSAGHEGSFSLIRVGTDNTAETIAPLGGFSDYTLGWGNNLDEIIYMSAKSGESELRQYTLSTKADIALQSHLPLIQ